MIKKLRRAFGTEHPKFFANVRYSRIFNGEMMGCSYCFPHGMDTINNRYLNYQRCWKKFRKTQYRTKKLDIDIEKYYIKNYYSTNINPSSLASQLSTTGV